VSTYNVTIGVKPGYVVGTYIHTQSSTKRR